MTNKSLKGLSYLYVTPNKEFKCVWQSRKNKVVFKVIQHTHEISITKNLMRKIYETSIKDMCITQGGVFYHTS